TPADGIGYGIDGDVPTYNIGSTAGQTSAARQAFARVQTGFSYPGPHGDAIADTDFGTITPVPGDPVSIEYQINPAAHYSDGAPVVCDDMVLAWAAHNGRFQSLFDAPVDPTMAAIEAIDCKSGQRTAVVHYSGDRAVTDWKSAFGAGSMLPSHVVSAGAGNVDIAAAVENEDVDALAPVADYWNTAFTLQPGDADQSVFVSSGPYRLDKVHDDGSIELIANEKWWGDPARTEHIMIHPRSASIGSLASDGDVDVVDIGAGSTPRCARLPTSSSSSSARAAISPRRMPGAQWPRACRVNRSPRRWCRKRTAGPQWSRTRVPRCPEPSTTRSSPAPRAAGTGNPTSTVPAPHCRMPAWTASPCASATRPPTRAAPRWSPR
ncbi:MAG: ABC transporter substrate-binding protein, partial [Tomitella sp.]|nr:ABC transporter substrate-binding protein [Tomitella sp.]